MSRETWELMQHMETEGLEVQMIIQCAPVIAGLKVSNLLIIPDGQLFQLKELLKDSGISMYLLLKEEGRLVILLYHREWLQRMLGEPDRKAWMVKAGYKTDYDSMRAGHECSSLPAILSRFRRRYQSSPMKWESCLDIRWRMWKVLSYIREAVTFATDTGKCIITFHRNREHSVGIPLRNIICFAF